MNITATTPEQTFGYGEDLARRLAGGEVVLLYGGLGAGKTLLTKGILSGLGYDTDEVTSPSFTLVNLYKTEKFDVYHIDLWRLDGVEDPATAVGLDEVIDAQKSITIIEWADRLRKPLDGVDAIRIEITGDGDDPRTISVGREEVEPWRTKA